MRTLAAVIALSFVPALLAQNGLIVSVAGNGTTGTSGIGGPAVNAPSSPLGICIDHADNLYIAEPGNNRVLKVDGITGILTLVAGNGAASSAGDNGPAIQASLNRPYGVAADVAGNLFISEFSGNRVRRVDAATGIITTVAGNGTAGFAGDGGPAVNGSLSLPIGLVLDTAGNLYIADAGNYRVRRVDGATGTLTTVAGNGTNNHSPDGTAASGAALALPFWVSVDSQGNLLITEIYASAIRRVSAATGLLSTVAGNGATTFNGDGEPATGAALGSLSLSNVASDVSGNLYFADGNGRVRRVDPSGIITTVAGSGVGAHGKSSSGGGGGGGSFTCPSGIGDNGPATIATLNGVSGVALTSRGNLLISDGMDCEVRGVLLPSPLLYTSTSLSMNGQTPTVTVTPIGGSAAPTGTVQFVEYVEQAPGPWLPLTSATLSGGTASLDLSTLTAGSHNVMAIYTGDGAYNGSGSAPLAVTGGGRATPAMSTVVPYPVLVSTPITLTITVVGSRGQPTGSVQMSEGATLLSSLTVVNGAAQFSYVSSITGVHQITAQYSGDSNYTPFSWTFPITVLVPSTVTLAATPNPANVGAGVMVVGTVSPATATGRMAFYDGGSLLGTSNLFNGTAGLTVSTLAAGTHSITAAYNGDFVVAPAASNAVTETINTITPTTLALATSGSPSTWNQGVTLTATISPAAAAGPVNFYDGAVQLGSATLSGGSASLTTPQLAVGNHTITAVYNANAGYGASTSPAVTQTVNKASASTVLVSSLNPVATGQSVTFTATVSPSAATGSVQFLDGATLLGTAPVSGGSASLASTTLTVGSHSITAAYSGDGSYNTANSPVLTETVTKAPSSTVLSASTGTSVYGQSVILTTTVTPAAATGTVDILDGATVLVTLPVNGPIPVLNTSTLAAGTHTLTAVYSGDATYAGSTSPASTVTVSKAATTIGLTSSVNPSASGQPVVFTATLTPTTATGNVQFLDGATVIGTVATVFGSASFSTAGLAAGSHSITVVYAGDANCNAVTSTVVTQTVNKLPSSTALSAGSGTIVYGQSVSLTASLAPASATGSVQFLDGATVLGTSALSSGTASLTAANLAVGMHSITAVYGGDPGTDVSTSSPVTVSVSKAAASTTLGSSLNPSVAGQTVTFSATVTPAAATGSVQFLDGATVIGTAALSGGTASVSTAGLAAGSHAITAVYSGDGNYNAATSTSVTQTVTKAPTSTTVSASSGTITLGQSVQLTASVTPVSATGTVQFLDGATVLGTSTVSGGTASLTAANLAVGTHSITAVYSGDAGNSGSTSSAVTVSVSKAGASVTLGSSPNPSGSGQAVTFTATVTPAAATGSVQFLDGATAIGTATLSGGTATLGTAALASGNHTMTAVYSGDSNYNGATSTSVTQTVTKAPTSTTVSASSGTITLGQSVQLTASVTATSATGTVQFLDGATVIGTSALSGGAASLTAANLAVGSHSITAVYGGDAGNAGSTSAPVTVSVSKAGASVTLGSSPNPSGSGQAVTFTATVTPAGATGSVQFLDGATAIGTAALSGGTASLSTAALAAGSHSITAVYSGDTNYNGATSGALAQTVKAVTTTTLSANKSTAVAGQTVTFTATVSPAAATGNVQFLDGATAIGTVALSGGSAVLAVSNLAVGSHSVTASYGGAAGYAGSASSAVGVTITAAPPAAPSNLVATAASSSQINLTWTASATSGVTYNVYASGTAGFTPSAGNRIASGVTVTSYAHTGLAASATWYYVVTAQNANGESAVSNQAGATTAAGASCKVTYTVTNQWNVGFGTAITIKNTGPAPITGWQLTWKWLGNQQITQSWNSNYSQTGQNATLTNASWNPTIAAGATLSGMGFNGSYSGSNNSPAAFYLNGTKCQ
ncbi:MAG TPA: Ig-like domain repeat protein [Bryobacteraceae bacterium]|nr:Ig-like domain repeat protein [Bryobacteraceae bacterium]